MKRGDSNGQEEMPGMKPPPFEKTRMAGVVEKTVAVHPLFSPPVRTLILVGISLVTGALVLLLTRPRPDLKVVSWTVTYGPAIVELAIGALALWTAMRWSIPGSGAAFRRSCIGVVAAFVLALALAMIAPSLVGPDHQWFLAGMKSEPLLPCLVWEVSVAVPVFLFAVWLILRGAVTESMLAGSLAGLGAGLIADAAIHLHCPAVALAHTIPCHLGTVFLLTVAGALAGRFLPRW